VQLVLEHVAGREIQQIAVRHHQIDEEGERREIGEDARGAGGLRLGGAHQGLAGSCWVMQWMPPPPSTMSSASICRMSRSGKHDATVSRAFSSLASSKAGMTTPPFGR